MTPYQLEFFNARVRDEILGWPSGIAAHFAALAVRIEMHGPDFGMPYTRAMGGGLFEIRARGAEGIGRALFCTLVGQRVVILHGFIKKTQQTPDRELQLARRRLREVRDGQKDR